VPLLVGPTLGLGYVTHLITDGMTKTGVPLLWPLTDERIRVMPEWLSPTTGGFFDWLVGFVCMAGSLWLLTRGGGL
jgi:membrane-bound metal-dependent hydrolase YbcI (DUF457 family)